jgi:hypothetical protein
MQLEHSSLPSVCTGLSDGFGHDDFDFNFFIILALDLDIGASGWLDMRWLQGCGNIMAGKDHHGTCIVQGKLKEWNKVPSESMNLLSSHLLFSSLLSSL